VRSYNSFEFYGFNLDCAVNLSHFELSKLGELTGFKA